MSIAELRGVLETVDDVSSCSGTLRVTERIAVLLPDGDVGAVDDAIFVDWLLAHSEPAPYGHGGVTKIDPKVRSARRLTARGEARVHGFELASILPQIEAAMSPTVKLSARLTDVIVYQKGDKFTRHKDTPRSTDLVGTLIVELPIAYTGGAFVVDDGRGAKQYHWSGKPEAGVVPWVALFTDVDHEIKAVTSGARVTVVYALHRTDERRSDPGAEQRQALVRRAAGALSRQDRWPVMIACGRQVIAEPDAPQPQSIESLRGVDRDVAEALVDAGYQVTVRACIAAIPNYNDPPRWPETGGMWAISRLRAVPPLEILEGLGDEGVAGEIEGYMLDEIMLEQWVVRRSAAATLVHENGCWAADGMDFGNEGFDALVYTLAAIEVSKPKGKAAAKSKVTAKEKAAAKSKAAAKATAKSVASKSTAKPKSAAKPVASNAAVKPKAAAKPVASKAAAKPKLAAKPKAAKATVKPKGPQPKATAKPKRR